MREIVHAAVARTIPAAAISDFSAAAPALRQILDAGADLLITDCNMEGMDGPTLVRSLRQNGHLLPIIMVSGSTDAREMGEEAGIDRFISKDAVNSLLPAAIRSLIAM